METESPPWHMVAFLCGQLSSAQLWFPPVFSPLWSPAGSAPAEASRVPHPAPLDAAWAMLQLLLQTLVILKGKSPHLEASEEHQQQEWGELGVQSGDAIGEE